MRKPRILAPRELAREIARMLPSIPPPVEDPGGGYHGMEESPWDDPGIRESLFVLRFNLPLLAEVLREIAGHNIDGAPIGHLAFGEYIYAAGNKSFQSQEWMQVVDPEVLVRFPIESLVSRRSFIFARAGFGKSNLNKLLFSKLYENTPFVTKRAGKQVPVGTVIFDPDGEYFWPDDEGRPASSSHA